MTETDSWLRLRQIAIVASDRDVVTKQLCDVFGLNVAYHDASLESLGLHNSLTAINDQFIEVVAPIRENTTAERYRKRRGGDTGYMVIFQTNDHAKHRALVEKHGVRVVANFSAPGFHNMQLHPADTGGVFFEIDQEDDLDKWHPAGKDWRNTVDTSVVQAITGVDIACTNPENTATRWSQLLDVPVSIGSNCGMHKLRLGTETIRFVPAGVRGEGLESVEIRTSNIADVVARATQASLPCDANNVNIGGVTFVLKN
jgi:hypothetical protein